MLSCAKTARTATYQQVLSPPPPPPPPPAALILLTTISSRCPPDYFNHCRKTQTITVIYVLLQEKRGPSHAFYIPLLTVYEVAKRISGLANKIPMGPDNIPTHLLKLFLLYTIEPSLYNRTSKYIYNLCIQKYIFPKLSKSVNVILLPKNNRSDPNKFRSFSLLPVLSKPPEKHVNNYLSTFME